MKTLINTLYIGLLIIAPVCASFFLITEQITQYNFHCPFDPSWLFMLALLAVLFAPMILALIQNTAHKIAISLLNLALLGLGDSLFKNANQTGNETGPIFFLVALSALWLWQCFDGRRPRKLPR
jgi:hypothetical protein